MVSGAHVGQAVFWKLFHFSRRIYFLAVLVLVIQLRIERMISISVPAIRGRSTSSISICSGFLSAQYAINGRPSGSRALSALQFIERKHGSAATYRSTIARCILFIAIKQAIIVGNFFARGDIANRAYPNVPINFIRLAVRIAGMIDKHRHAVSVDDLGSIADRKEISDRFAIVAAVRLIFIDDGTGIFDDQ